MAVTQTTAHTQQNTKRYTYFDYICKNIGGVCFIRRLDDTSPRLYVEIDMGVLLICGKSVVPV